MERVSFILIDQVRANMKIESRFQAATNEKGVGDFGNYKSATAVSALQHNLRQWIWISKGIKLKPADPLGVDGWVMHVYTEKNKLAPSQFFIPLVFDKKWGIVPFYSEYYFLKEKTKTEKRYWPNPKKLIYPFSIVSSANSKKLVVIDPITNNVLYDSGKIMERKIMARYNDDPEFHQWFDKAVDISIDQRIKHALFRDTSGTIEIGQTNPNCDPDEIDGTDDSIASAFDNVDIGGDIDDPVDPNYEQKIISEVPVVTEVAAHPQDLGSEASSTEPPSVDDDHDIQQPQNLEVTVEDVEESNPFLVPDKPAT